MPVANDTVFRPPSIWVILASSACVVGVPWRAYENPGLPWKTAIRSSAFSKAYCDEGCTGLCTAPFSAPWRRSEWSVVVVKPFIDIMWILDCVGSAEFEEGA